MIYALPVELSKKKIAEIRERLEKKNSVFGCANLIYLLDYATITVAARIAGISNFSLF